MDKSYQLNHNYIKVFFEERLIRLCSDDQLWLVLQRGSVAKLTTLMLKVKADYQQKFNKPLLIKTDSLIIEVIVHVFFHRLGLKFNRFVKFRWLNNIVEQFIRRAEVIDCGESVIDSNRWFWDVLSKFKPLIYSKIIAK